MVEADQLRDAFLTSYKKYETAVRLNASFHTRENLWNIYVEARDRYLHLEAQLLPSHRVLHTSEAEA